jgi:hypothetical protein
MTINSIRLSATSIGCFKDCPMRYYYRYGLGLVPIEDTESQRMGTNWHRVHEIADMKPGGVCECVITTDGVIVGPWSNCALCQGSGRFPDDPMDAVVRHLNETYSTPPVSKTIEEWEVERVKLLYSLVGYQWYYNDESYQTEQLEQKFNLPLLSPVTGRKLQAELNGKIDRVFATGANRFVHEYKSTSKNVDPDSTYWGHLTLDTQTRLYTYAAKQLGMGMCGVLYDVWRKPQISPKKLTQTESKKFIVDGLYCGETFEILGGPYPDEMYANKRALVWEPGVKEGTFAIRETPEMYGARLLQDITQRPEFYFARREIVHQSNDLEAFEWELFNIYHSIRQMGLHNRWWRNENQCENAYRCSYIDFCYNHLDIGPDDTPDNFKKIGGGK